MQHTLSAAVSIHKTPNKQVKQINSMKNYIFILAFLLTLLDSCKKNDVKDNVVNAWQESKEEVKREAENQRHPFSTYNNNMTYNL